MCFRLETNFTGLRKHILTSGISNILMGTSPTDLLRNKYSLLTVADLYRLRLFHSVLKYRVKMLSRKYRYSLVKYVLCNYQFKLFIQKFLLILKSRQIPELVPVA